MATDATPTEPGLYATGDLTGIAATWAVVDNLFGVSDRVVTDGTADRAAPFVYFFDLIDRATSDHVDAKTRSKIMAIVSAEGLPSDSELPARP